VVLTEVFRIILVVIFGMVLELEKQKMDVVDHNVINIRGFSGAAMVYLPQQKVVADYD